MEDNTNMAAPSTVVDNKPKDSKGLKIATAIACIFGICGIGFGVYGVMQGLEKDNQISNLKAEVNSKSAKIQELETTISNLNNKTEEIVIDTETTTPTDTTEQNATEQNTTEQTASNDDNETVTILLKEILDKNDDRTVYKAGDCTADGPSVKCPVTINGKNALISYNSNDSILRLTLFNN